MEILSQKYPGRIHICDNCGALLGAIKDSDIYGDILWCPLCKSANKLDYNKNYDGIVIPEEKECTTTQITSNGESQ